MSLVDNFQILYTAGIAKSWRQLYISSFINIRVDSFAAECILRDGTIRCRFARLAKYLQHLKNIYRVSSVRFDSEYRDLEARACIVRAVSIKKDLRFKRA